jgi:DNA-binding FrmR family transcriptional regulator
VPVVSFARSAGLGPLALSPLGGYAGHMTDHTHHATHPEIINRLKRANGHLLSVIAMIEAGRACTDIAQQLYAVEKAIAQAKRTLIQDHIDHCLDTVVGEPDAGSPITTDFKTIIKYL